MKYVAMESRKGKNGRKLCYTLTDFYLEYQKECKLQYGKNHKRQMISKPVFMAVMKDYLAEMAEFIVKKRTSYKLPRMLGKMRIAKYKCTKPWKKNKRLEEMYDRSEVNREKLAFFWKNHSTTHYFVWNWLKKSTRGTIKYISWYGFTPARVLRKLLSNHIYECSLNPRVPNYNVKNERKKRIANPIQFPPL